MKQSKYDRLVADFETTTDPEDCRVWAWGVGDIFVDNNFNYGNSIESFIEFISKYPSHVYFHNLKFDGEFIIYWLLTHGYTHVDEAFQPLTFDTLISSKAQYYSITVMWENGVRTEFRDSLKKLPMSVAVVAKTFGLKESKKVIDYDEYRAPGHMLTHEEIAYLRADVLIVAKALKQQFMQGMTRLTVGSDSMAQFKTVCGARTYNHLFPVLSFPMDADIRKAYRGGFTYADPRTQAQIVGKGRVFDVNSLYPSVMYSELMPWGTPEFFHGEPEPDDEWPLYIVAVTILATLKPGHIPCIQVKGSMFFMATEYVTEITEPTTIAATNVDLALWAEHYDLDILAWDGGWKFRAMNGIFSKYIDKWMSAKEEADRTDNGGLRAIAKLHLVSLYGKFATNPDVTPRIPVLNDDGVLELHIGKYEQRPPIYTAVGVFVTSYGRDITIRSAQKHYDSFLYADTDSLHLLGDVDPDGLDIDDTRLGAWKREKPKGRGDATLFDEAIYVRAKCYCEKLSDGSFITHIAGLPDQIASQVTFRDFYNGRVFEGKLIPNRVKGGIVLSSTGFTLNI